MSRAFVKEDGGERWTPPQKAAEYRVLDTEAGAQAVYEADDLLSALRWVSERPQNGFEVRASDGRLLAVS